MARTCLLLALTGGAGRPQVGRLLKVDRQCFRCGRSSQAGPVAELPRSMNAAYSRLGLVGDARDPSPRPRAFPFPPEVTTADFAPQSSAPSPLPVDLPSNPGSNAKLRSGLPPPGLGRGVLMTVFGDDCQVAHLCCLMMGQGCWVLGLTDDRYCSRIDILTHVDPDRPLLSGIGLARLVGEVPK
jgi:hypothetical protein